MNWTRSETLALAQQSCTICFGLGLLEPLHRESRPCHCVERAIFRACYERFRQCASKEAHISRVSLEANPGRQRKGIYGRKNGEYVADFILVSRRVLDENTAAYRLFKYYFLLGADWKLCCRKLGIDRGEFFHEVYRIQQRLGRVFRELEPFALFPLDEYFSSGGTRQESVSSVPLKADNSDDKAAHAGSYGKFRIPRRGLNGHVPLASATA